MKKIISELGKRVLMIPIDNRSELLEWFAEAYYYNEELLSAGIYSKLYEKLSMVYKPLTEDVETLKLLRQIKTGEKEANVENMSLVLLEQIMIGLKGNLGLDIEHGIDKLLFDYHSKYNRAFINDLYMQRLNDNIDKKVMVIGLIDKQPMIESGVLESVDDYSSIRINGDDIQFVGFKQYIKDIRDEDNKKIYYNGKKYNMSLLNDSKDVYLEQKELFGKENTKSARRAA